MSDYQIIVTRSAQKELNSLSPEINSRIKSKIDTLVNNPRLSPHESTATLEETPKLPPSTKAQQ